jgi:hypothetical protein
MNMLRALAALCSMVAVVCMTLAIIGMVTGRPGERAGFYLRLGAVVFFSTAVVLNLAAH